jgi:ribonuclease HI
MNEAADERARAVAEAFRRGATAIPSGPGWTRDGAVDVANDDLELEPADVVDPVDAASEEEALFSLDELPEEWHTVTLDLSAEEYERLLVRARAEGVPPEEFLRGLI